MLVLSALCSQLSASRGTIFKSSSYSINISLICPSVLFDTGDQRIASMVTRSPTWPQRSVPPVLTPGPGAGVGAVAAPAGTAAVNVTGFGGAVAAAGGGGAAGGEVGAGGPGPGPQAGSRLARVAETSMASAERRLSVNLFGLRIASPSPRICNSGPRHVFRSIGSYRSTDRFCRNYGAGRGARTPVGKPL